MQTTTLSFANMHNHGELFANLLRARRQSFIVQNRWDLPQAMGMEFDQYDTPASRWVAVHQLGRIYAGIRLTPTTARVGIYSYMIRDAQRGLLDSIPSDLLYDEAPVAENVWESSRVFVAHDTPEKLRRVVHLHLIDEMTKAARDLGATQVLGLISASWPRWAQRRGLDAHAAGRVMEIEGSKNQVVSINLAEKMH
ncbi:MAG: N-acyl-L-homoserine lactone synthetase [Maritimibacter sp.]|nr:N-acyl-L-homoserine lactone synthetase [Maritimibacter sp.]